MGRAVYIDMSIVIRCNKCYIIDTIAIVLLIYSYLYTIKCSVHLLGNWYVVNFYHEHICACLKKTCYSPGDTCLRLFLNQEPNDDNQFYSNCATDWFYLLVANNSCSSISASVKVSIHIQLFQKSRDDASEEEGEEDEAAMQQSDLATEEPPRSPDQPRSPDRPRSPTPPPQRSPTPTPSPQTSLRQMAENNVTARMGKRKQCGFGKKSKKTRTLEAIMDDRTKIFQTMTSASKGPSPKPTELWANLLSKKFEKLPGDVQEDIMYNIDTLMYHARKGVMPQVMIVPVIPASTTMTMPLFTTQLPNNDNQFCDNYASDDAS